MIHVHAGVGRSLRIATASYKLNMEIPVKIEKFKDSLLPFSQEFREVAGHANELVTFVINPLKNTNDEVLQNLKMRFDDIESTEIPNVFQINSGSNFKQDELVRGYFDSGLIYFMEKSSMLASLSIQSKGGALLDMCAAPGGKTYFAQAISENGFFATLLDNNKNRLYRTEDNLRNLGVKNFETLYADSGAITKTHPEFLEKYDVVILDAPCSNESKLDFNNPESFKYWNPKLPSKLSKLQKRMISEAVKVVKSGGEIIYSTCTYNTIENEEVIKWALAKFPNLTLEELDFAKFGAEKEPELRGQELLKKRLGYRVVPKNGYTGFFVSRLIKN